MPRVKMRVEHGKILLAAEKVYLEKGEFTAQDIYEEITRNDYGTRKAYSIGAVGMVLRSMAEVGLLSSEVEERKKHRWRYRYRFTDKGSEMASEMGEILNKERATA